MTQLTVRPLGAEDWQTYRDVRLSALRDAPDAFAATLADEEAYDEAAWRARMSRSTRLLAAQDDEPVGIASVGTLEETDKVAYAQIFGLYVVPALRGAGVATALVKAAVDVARRSGKSHLAYWVGTDNGPAVAFASGFGFRPADARRPMRTQGATNGEQEIMMTLALGPNRGEPTVYSI